MGLLLAGRPGEEDWPAERRMTRYQSRNRPIKQSASDASGSSRALISALARSVRYRSANLAMTRCPVRPRPRPGRRAGRSGYRRARVPGLGGWSAWIYERAYELVRVVESPTERSIFTTPTRGGNQSGFVQRRLKFMWSALTGRDEQGRVRARRRHRRPTSGRGHDRSCPTMALD